MSSSIINVKTPDGLCLYGLWHEVAGSKTLLLHTHGTAGNFYEENFINFLAQKLVAENISILSANNRGAGVYDAYQKSGAAVEHFEDCVTDLNSWLNWARGQGYERIILSGHSLGTEKVVYSLTHSQEDMGRVVAVILFAPADSYGSHRYLDGQLQPAEQTRVENLLKLAEELVTKGEGDTFLPRDTYGSYEGIMPKSADSFLNFLGENSKVKDSLPFYSKELPNYRRIKVPILALIGDEEEYTSLPITEALALMQKENLLTETKQFSHCNHDFEGHEAEVAEAVLSFINKSL